MFRRLHEAAQTVAIEFEGDRVEAAVGDSVAAALLAAGAVRTRTTAVTGSPRAPYCMMGVCFDCLMVIDGVESRQACMVTVAEGMIVHRQTGKRGLPQ